MDLSIFKITIKVNDSFHRRIYVYSEIIKKDNGSSKICNIFFTMLLTMIEIIKNVFLISVVAIPITVD